MPEIEDDKFRSRLDARDWRRFFLGLVLKPEIKCQKFSVSSRSARLNQRNSHSRLEIEKMTLVDLWYEVNCLQRSPSWSSVSGHSSASWCTLHCIGCKRIFRWRRKRNKTKWTCPTLQKTNNTHMTLKKLSKRKNVARIASAVSVTLCLCLCLSITD